MLLFIYNLWSYCAGLRGPVLNFVQGLGFVRDGPAHKNMSRLKNRDTPLPEGSRPATVEKGEKRRFGRRRQSRWSLPPPMACGALGGGGDRRSLAGG
jgi:hypothetical protein